MKFNNLAGFGVVGGESRQCGRSLSLALGAISKALEIPGVKVYVIDHYSTMAADRILFDTVVSLCDQMGLKYMEFTRSNNTIKFNLYSEVDGPDVVLHQGKLLRKIDTTLPKVYHLEGHAYS